MEGNSTIFVGNLPYNVTWQDLKDMFTECGTIVRADVAQGERGSKGFGTITFSTPQEASHAISEFNGADLDGRTIEVCVCIYVGLGRFGWLEPWRGLLEHATAVSAPLHANAKEFKPSAAAAPAVEQASEKALFVGNLAWSVEWDTIKALFSQHGPVESGEVAHDYNGRSKGFAIVKMATVAGAKSALAKLHGHELEGRPLEVRADKGSKKPASPAKKPAPSKPAKAEQAPTQRLIVQNLAEGVQWHELKDHFKNFGPVSRADVQAGPNGGLIGFVTIPKALSLDAISQLSGSVIQGSSITVAIDNGAIPVQTPPPTGYSVYVGNLPFQVRWQDLKDLFSDGFTPIRADVMMETPTRSKGFGVVKFATLEEAERAVAEYQGASVQGRPIVVRLDKYLQ
ncbi:hypothetical protein HDU91_007106 [Kappamyces sp. JEL0680]|nr:hypothetical protein HDU91_007106 [Kappamyces sp. JEL0680]